jgi:hypothetical protein
MMVVVVGHEVIGSKYAARGYSKKAKILLKKSLPPSGAFIYTGRWQDQQGLSSVQKKLKKKLVRL